MRFVRLRAFRRIFLQGIGFFLAGSIALTLLFRWVPVPWSSLMIQRQIAAAWQGDGRYRLVHTWVNLEQVSLYAPLAVIAAEDQKFFDHDGFDFGAMNKAWQANPHRRRPLGASTISQQVAKNLYLWSGRTFFRKGVEAYFTLLLEGLWPKRRILEVYLNVVELGPGIFGVEAASHTYFHKSAAKLTSTEAALLAAILPSPLRSDLAHPTGYILSRVRHIERQMKLMGGSAYLKQMVRPEKK
ncbi:MAG: monofunctional biosynthetic peptidoglycan transglycosylase [Deltaproteobacteria bacterium]|nr:monofunctional biosynthetic peptidoglycan transglycosylase [Deltaproteobacteria bacterium]